MEHLPAYHLPLLLIPERTRAQSRLPKLEGSFSSHQVKRKRLAIHCDSRALSVRLIHTGSVPITACSACISSGVRGTANILSSLAAQAAKPSSQSPLPLILHSPL